MELRRARARASCCAVALTNHPRVVVCPALTRPQVNFEDFSRFYKAEYEPMTGAHRNILLTRHKTGCHRITNRSLPCPNGGVHVNLMHRVGRICAVLLTPHRN